MSKQHYDAFISYRHETHDIEVAKQIQQSLEHFHIPKQIKEKYGVEGFKHIFRDQEDLELSHDLSKKIEDALNASDYLIVICSPHYKESKWCLKELETFIEKNGPEKVFCVLSEGEPPEIFPEQLLKRSVESIDKNGRKRKKTVDVEPLACDYRDDFKKAKKIELPRLASAMIGCSYDELIERQEKYRRKRILTIGSIISSLAIIAITYLIWSNIQIRNNYNQSLINESKVLAKQSLDYYAKQDRKRALEDSISSLDGDRPVIPEAIYSLSKASYAYQSPYNYLETWRIDDASDIDNYFISKDNSYIVYTENDGTIYTADMNSHEVLMEKGLFTNGSPGLISEAGNKELVTYDSGTVYNIDYLSGEIKWSLPLKYQAIGKVAVSNDRQYIAAADSFAVQIMTVNGEYYLSLPLSEDIEGYITDLCWSDDDTYILVKIKNPDQQYSLGVYDLNDYSFHHISEAYNELLDFGFLKNNNIYLIGNNRSSDSLKYGDSIQYINNNYYYSVYELENRITHKEFNDSSIIEKAILIDDEDYVILALGNKIYLLNNEEILNNYEVNESIIKIIEVNDNYLDIVTSDGYRGLLWLSDNTSILRKSFPERLDNLSVRKDKNDSYIIHHNGNLLIYESVYDENIELNKSIGFNSSPDEHLFNDDHLLMKVDDKLISYDISENNNSEYSELDEDYAYHLLNVNKEKISVLRIDTRDGKMSILNISTNDMKLLNIIDLPVSDFYISNNILTYPLSKADKLFIENQYLGASSIVMNENHLYIHDYDNPNKLIVYDFDEETYKTIDLSIEDYILLNTDNNYYRPSQLILSDDEKYLYTVGCSLTQEKEKKSFIINLETMDYITLDIVPDDNFSIILEDEKLFISNEHNLSVYDYNGEMLYEIKHINESIYSFDYHDGLLYCIYPDNVLKLYQKNKLIKEVSIPERNYNYLNNRLFRYQYHDDKLYLFFDHDLDFFDLNDANPSAIYSIRNSALDYDEINNNILVYSFDAESLDGYYYLGKYHEYNIEEMLSRAKNQLNNIE